ncbi:hypothetical protein BGZ92_010977 [Podila epicladia]|nr:hypothetical protein BGZ92_010977 [Podila epicladia]
MLYHRYLAKGLLGSVATPVLNAFRTLVDGSFTTTNIDIWGTATIAVKLMCFLKFVAPDSYQVEVQTYIDKIPAFQATI